MTALILGIVAIVGCAIPIVNFVSIVLGVGAVVLGIIALVQKNRSRGLAIAGTILGGLALIVGITTASIYAAALNSVSDALESSAPAATGDAATPSPSTEAADESSSSSSDSDVPAEYTSALKSAQNYSDMMHLSKEGIRAQLTSDVADQFSDEAAAYAVDHVKADWNANALATAKTYQDSMNMSPEAIRDQLSSDADKFSQSEADYAVAHLND
ncbi:Ltp family lipoprotein [Curtobacterium flaccumfaciens]|nr:Ltp family lipoprotein [Curtobacterium flaccumfaciens]